jgi:hypothetical protein
MVEAKDQTTLSGSEAELLSVPLNPIGTSIIADGTALGARLASFSAIFETGSGTFESFDTFMGSSYHQLRGEQREGFTQGVVASTLEFNVVAKLVLPAESTQLIKAGGKLLLGLA